MGLSGRLVGSREIGEGRVWSWVGWVGMGGASGSLTLVNIQGVWWSVFE